LILTTYLLYPKAHSGCWEVLRVDEITDVTPEMATLAYAVVKKLRSELIRATQGREPTVEEILLYLDELAGEAEDEDEDDFLFGDDE
jgi:hypothetical protein